MLFSKSFLKGIIPPVIIRAFRAVKSGNDTFYFKGLFETWKEALVLSEGYESDVILDNCKKAMLEIKSGNAVYERDSVLFNEIKYSWGVLAGLQKTAIENNLELCVLDFGGSLGSSYYQNRKFLNNIKVTWCIVEQKHFVNCGRENFANDELHFFYTVEECLSYFSPNVILLSGVLQYLEDPVSWIDKFLSIDAKYLVVDRSILSEQEFITVQYVPEIIYKASYPVRIFSIKSFLTPFKRKFKTIVEFPTVDNFPSEIEGNHVFYKGYFMCSERI
jgi:putative methyltransferase (TIGR04325 family)